ncbi:aminotransferase class V-fold PLP-dependent enzyme [Cyanobium sp. Morenito 9A2]|uniref:aminotransferase class V-fold PLP-dependent enzyme n=1 Tax=Cyanobium sp. Morenito 9A2 TaxID=2823718 RepID=UPI0020CCB33A|nr:aminotransferase class V-fold PLP-dependent enzyme [Cyanobium sp. Morenito 9A2]MCP9848245.1 aminotransferase class V-fold PLP-dependent enzyme [Cyanobium sp. Morenito 9A2]
MPALTHKTYFNYGGQGPLPTPSLEAISEAFATIQELGPFTSALWPWLETLTSRLRRSLAASCGVPTHRLALTENVSSGCVLPLWGLPWEPGDQILISDCEHHGVVAACTELARRQGLQLGRFGVKTLVGGNGASAPEAALDALERALTPSTRLVVLSHLLWNTGVEMPIPAVAERLAAHPRRPWLLVDAAQSFGSLPIGPAAGAADIYAFTGHKWACGPEGLGGVALSERVLEQASPTLIGWRNLRQETDEHGGWHPDGRRFEVATSCVPLVAGLLHSLELLEQVGPIERRLELIKEPSGRLWRGLQDAAGVKPVLEAPPTAGLVSFHVEGHDPTAVVKALGERGLWIRSLEQPACLRACTHLTTTEGEVDHLLEALASL